MSVDFDKLMSLFQEALEKHAPGDWDDFVNQAAGGDEELKRQACQLLHAQELLRRTPLTVTEAALAAGFQWATHFSQACAREFGCTPIQQRQVPKWRQVCRNDR